MITVVTAGTINTDFVVGDGFNDMVYTFKTQPDGKILVGGNFTWYNGTDANYITRLNQDGTLDETFNNGTFLSDDVKAIDVLSDGSILVGGLFSSYNGNTTNYFVKLTSNGSLNQLFSDGFNGTVRVIKVQSDDKILVGGDFGTYNGNNAFNLIRLNSNGTIDNTFNIGSGFNNSVYDIKIDSDGNILVGGKFTSCNSISANGIIKLDPTGTILNTFGAGINLGGNNRVQQIVIQPDNKILLGGGFSSYNNTSTSNMVRINTDGSIDTTFDFSYWVINMYVQSDNKIVVGGQYDNYNGENYNYIIRLNPSGSIDTSFYVGDGFNNTVNAITELSNGNLLLGGWFDTYNNENYDYIISLNNDTNTEQYPFIYEATSCPTDLYTNFYYTETFYVGSNVELTSGQVVSVSNIFSPTQIQCVTITSSNNIAIEPNYEYVSTYADCETCLTDNSVAALVRACTDSEFTLALIVNKNYKIGDILIVDYPFYYDDGGIWGVYLNDGFEILDLAPYFVNNSALPKIVDYQPQESCEIAQSILGRYYTYVDCDTEDYGLVKSNQNFNIGNTVFINQGATNCKTIFYTNPVYDAPEEIFNDGIQNARQLVSTKVFDNCGECYSQTQSTVSWSEDYNGDGNIIFNSSTDVEIDGPNDTTGDGWSYMYVQMASSGVMTFNWSYASPDEPGYDWGFWYVSSNQPVGDVDINFSENIIGEVDGDSGEVTINYSAGDWVSIGVYSTDSGSGPGILYLLFTQLANGKYQLMDFATCTNSYGKILIPSTLVNNSGGVTEIEYSPVSIDGLDWAIQDANDDDEYYEITFPSGFSIDFLGTNYTTVYPTSNYYMTFESGDGGCCFDIPNQIPSDIGQPGIFLSTACADGSYDGELYQMYSGLTDGGNTLIIKIIGSDHCDGTETVVYSYKFYKGISSYFDLVIEQNTKFFNNDPTGGISNGIDNNWLYTFDSSPEKSYRIRSTYPTLKANFDTQASVCGALTPEAVGGIGGSMYFDGNSSTNVNVNYNINMDLDFGSWTIEWFQYYTSTSTCCDRVFDIGSFNQEHVAASLEDGQIKLWLEAPGVGNPYNFTLNTSISNVWTHIAITSEDIGYPNRTLRVFQDGVMLPETYTITMDLNNFDGPTLLPLTIGSEGNGGSAFEGYITNFRWNKGTCYYTSDFTVPSQPLSVDGSQLLMLATDEAGLITDSSGIQTISQNGVTWSNKNPFTSQTLYFYESGDTYTNCTDCNQLYYIILRECITGDIFYVSLKSTTLDFIIDPKPYTGSLSPECYEVLGYNLHFVDGGEYTPAFFYDTLEECLAPFSANTEYIMCIPNCSGQTVQVITPHPTWTNNYGKAVVQMDAVLLGGNGWNN